MDSSSPVIMYRLAPKIRLSSDTVYISGRRTPHVEKVRNALGKLPGTVIADAGYGSEENYADLEQEKAEAIVKYSTYHQEKSKKWKQAVSKIDNWEYNEQTDTWTCPGGQTLVFW